MLAQVIGRGSDSQHLENIVHKTIFIHTIEKDFSCSCLFHRQLSLTTRHEQIERYAGVRSLLPAYEQIAIRERVLRLDFCDPLHRVALRAKGPARNIRVLVWTRP